MEILQQPLPLDYKVVCTRCGGFGFIPQFAHVKRGVCFKCQGARVVTRKFYPKVIGRFHSAKKS